MTTLAASIDSAQRTITLSGDVSAAVPSRLYAIEDEIVLLERFIDTPETIGQTAPLGLDRTTWFVQRGSAGSVAVPHAAGVPIYGAAFELSRAGSLAPPSPVDAGGAGSGETIPIGLIVMWGGLLSAIPTNWHLCDGTSGTPDLRGLFIKGTLAAANPGATGGAATHGHTTTQPADHAALSHAGATVGNHTFTQPAGHSNHAFTQPGVHTFTQAAAHSGHVFTQPGAHPNHAVTQPAAHVVTQPANHSAHVVTQPAAHADNIAHTHGLQGTGGTTLSTTGAFLATSSASGGSLRTATGPSLSQGTGASLTHASTAVDAHSAHSATAVDAHSATAVDAHSAHSGGAVDAHSAHSGAGVDAHAGGAVDAHSAHSGGAVDAHTVGQASQHAVQSHSGAAVNTVNSEPAYYSLAYIQKIA